MRKTDMQNLSEHVLAKIAQEDITPAPRWHFLLREGVICAAGLVSIGVGVLAVVAVIFEMRNAWWEAYEATHSSLLTFAVDALPLIWILLLLVFTVLLYESVRHLKRGYRYAIHTVVLASIGVSGVGGAALYMLGGGPFADEWIGEFVPYHRPLIERERERWMDPDDGRLAGIVRDVPFAENVLWVEGIDGEAYYVDMSDFSNEERMELRVGEHVRILGIPTTTPLALHGCAILTKTEDILQRAHPRRVLGMEETTLSSETQPLFARSKECDGLAPYARLKMRP